MSVGVDGRVELGAGSGWRGHTRVPEECEKGELPGVRGHADEQEGVAAHDKGETIETSVRCPNENK